MKGNAITISVVVTAPLRAVWDCFTNPTHVVHWNNASDDWHTPQATNDLRVGGSFTYRMEAKDGSVGFDFTGIYDEVIQNQRIHYTMEDGREVRVEITEEDNAVRIVEIFDPENENPLDMQKAGWQAILENFKKYVEEKHNS